MTHHTTSHIADTFERLPIFPLYRVFLFPCAILPLYIFEPRYRKMISDSLARDRLLAIAQLRPGFETDYEGRPAIRGIAGLGHIVAHKHNPDGTYNVLIEGLGRIQIENELQPAHLYREVKACLIQEKSAETLSFEQNRLIILPLVDKLAEHLGEVGPALRRLCDEIDSLPVLVDVLASALVHTPGLRRRLFECANLEKRTDLLIWSLAKISSDLQNTSLQN